ncbi:MAG: zinc-dependent alcohol dehydrogenase [Arachnia sp.]
MGDVVEFWAPGQVRLVPEDPEPLGATDVRVATVYSGISAGTELTAYRGSNPYLTKTWDESARLFVDGEATFAYPVRGWGYSEVGCVVEVGSQAHGLVVGVLVHGIWGHRSQAVRPAEALSWRRIPEGLDPVAGTFARVGSIALNAVLAADVRLGEHVAIFGQGVIGLLATRLAGLAGGRVVAVDAIPQRRDLAVSMGAQAAIPPEGAGGAGAAIRGLVPGGVDCAIELSGSTHALHEAIRAVRPDGLVAASGFYQGAAEGLRLGEEFHHNRVRIVASQIGGVPAGLAGRWDQPRLVRTVMGLIQRGSLDVAPLVTDVVDAADVAEIFHRLDAGDPAIVQAVLRFEQP